VKEAEFADILEKRVIAVLIDDEKSHKNLPSVIQRGQTIDWTKGAKSRRRLLAAIKAVHPEGSGGFFLGS
jgi:hypothetical protein